MADEMDKEKEELQKTESRRRFIKKIGGGFLFSITILSQKSDGSIYCDNVCDGTPPNTSCDSTGEFDGTCGLYSGVRCPI